MILLDGFDIEGLDFTRDRLSDNAYIANIRITYRGRFRDSLEVIYMPDETGLVLTSSRLSHTFVFDEIDYQIGKYPKSEVEEVCKYIGCNPKEVKALVDEIFEAARSDSMNNKD